MNDERPLPTAETDSSVRADDERRPKGRAPAKTARAIVLFGLVALVVAVSGIRGRSSDEEKLAKWTDEQAIPTVAIEFPKRGGETREVVLPGDVEAFYSASIHGQVSGYVREWRKDIGAKVRQGDVLAVVETPELEERISVADSELNKAIANQQLARVTAQRWNSLRNSAAVSQQAADEKQSDASAKDAEVQAAQANVDRLKALKAFANIVAPFDGVVTSRNIDVGSLVKAEANDSAALFTVADIHRMRVYVHAPESYAAVLKDGMKATLQMPEYPDRVFSATIETTSHSIDTKSRSLLVELIADNADGALSPGAFARVHFQVPPDPDAVTIPANALVFRDNATEVATIGANTRVVMKKVRIARDFGSEVEIAGGLSPSEGIVASPPESVAEGDQVRLAQAATRSGAAATRPESHELAETERGRRE
jgi:RND family efflux transporter MFP subunit